MIAIPTIIDAKPARLTLPVFPDHIPISPTVVGKPAIVAALCAEIGRRRGIAPLAILKGDRTHPVCRARWELFVHLRNRGWSFPAIGAATGFDHSSVIYGVRRYLDEQQKGEAAWAEA